MEQLPKMRHQVKPYMAISNTTRTLLATIAFVLMTGCGAAPGQSLLVTPREVEFGNATLNETVQAAAPVAGARLAIRAECDATWLTVAPAQAFSDGPDDKASFVFSVSRAAMKPGRNTCRVAFTAARHADTAVTVTADAFVAADFRASKSSARPGERVVFSDTTRVVTGAGPVTAWKWDFGDGAASSERNPVHAYDGPGAYTVTLAVTSASGNDVRIQQGCVTVRRPALPEADFVAATRLPVAGTPVQFRDLSAPGPSGIASWLWSFGDGASSTERNPLHIYAAAAVYDVYLTVRNATGPDTALKLGYIEVQPNRSAVNSSKQ